jgi:phosphate transport system substrate-binding protein
MKNVLILVLLLAALAVPLRAEPPTVRLGGAAVLSGELIAELEAQRADVKLQVVKDCAQADIADLVKGRVDVLLMSQYMTAGEIKAAKEAGVVLHPFTFAYEGIAVIVNRNNPLKKISRLEVREVIGGKIRVWEELGVSGGEMSLCLQEDGVWMRPADRNVIEPALREGQAPTALPQHLELLGGGMVPLAVGGRMAAIGFVGMSRLRGAADVKIVPVDGLLPTLPAVQGRSYPYIQGIYVYTRGLPSGEARAAVDYLTGSDARKILSKYGLVSGNN